MTSPDKTLTYSSYLKVDELLKLQEPRSKVPAHDEMLFIVVHQVYELWFKQILFELKSLLVRMSDDDLIRSFRSLQRVSSIIRLLIHQVDVLETMTPVEFNIFRSHLNPASGFQSAQFRELEWLGGLDPNEYKQFDKLAPEWRAAISQQGKGPTLRSALAQLLEKKGLGTSDTPENLQKMICAVYEDPKHLPLQKLCEHFIEFDELFSLWRFRHVQMVERMIGMKKGTGGSLGVAYLKGTLSKRFFPELWEARTALGGEY